MAKAFDRLRLTAVASALGLLAGLGGVTRSVRAATAPSGTSVTTGGAQWGEFANANTGPPTFGTDAFAMTDGSLTGPTRDDAFDGAMLCRVNGTTYTNPAGVVDISAVSGGTRITPAPATIGSLQVQLTYFASSSQPVLRGICSMTNPTGSPIGVTLLMGSNLGSDTNTVIQATDSGDTTVDNADRWFVSSDTTPTTGDPVLLIGRFGTGASALPTLVQTPGGLVPPNANDDFVDQYSFSVLPGQTVSIMQLAWLNTSVANATGNSGNFDSTTTLQSAGLLSDLSSTEIARIINYGPGAVVTSFAQIPTLSETGTLGLAIIVGATGLLYTLRRRQRRA